MRNAFVAMLMSHGTPLLYGGDEWLRTQLGNNNAYSTGSDNEYNWFDWGTWQAQDERWRMADFLKQLTRFRREHGYAVAPAEYGKGAPFAWKSAANSDQVNWGGKSVMLHYYDKTRGPELAILVNMEPGNTDFTLPAGRNWVRLVDTQQYFDLPATLTAQQRPARQSNNAWMDAPTPVTTPTYGVPGRSIVILEAR
jgi:glycogen operon protein